MASIINYVADGSTNQFQIPFTYINQADVVVTVNGATPTFTFLNSTTINIAATPASGAKVIIKRVTPLNALVDFTDGSTLFEADLDLAHQQNRLISEESRDRADSAIATINANIDNIDTVAGIASNVTTVAGNTANVNSVANNMAEVLTADDNAATATTKAAEASSSATTASAQATISTTKASESSASAAASLASKNAAATSENNAATSETNAANSATASANSASASSSSATSASGSATTATTKAAEALTSANNAAVSATNSANSATTATTKASEASASQSAAAISETNALNSKNAAASSAINAATSETNSASSATSSANSAASATTKANEAAASATAASSSATASANSATASAASAASITGAETNAANSATAAASSATAASASKDAALAALDNFDDRYLGVKSSNPSVDNDGNALVAGSLYFNSTDDTMKVYEGSSWVAAYASLSGAVLQANNLSDLTSVATARTNLGLGTAATTAATAYATAAQGTTADSALPKAGGTMTGHLSFGDTKKAIFGTGSDFRIYHDGSNSYIEDIGDGILSIDTNGSMIQLVSDGSGANGKMAEFLKDGAVKLYYDNALKLATTSTGVDVTGNVLFNGNGVVSVQSSSNNMYIGGGTYTPAELNLQAGTSFMRMYTNGSERMRIDASGNVGIGTSSPQTELHVHDSAGLAKIRLSGTASSADTFEIAQGTAGVTNGGLTIRDVEASADRLVINSSGNVGIGDSSPASITSDVSTLSLNGTNTGVSGGLAYKVNGSTKAYHYINSGNLLHQALEGTGQRFLTNNSERMRITSSGNVGIGTSSPSAKLHVDGTLRTTGSVTHNSANLNLIADDARILIEEADGTDIVWLGDHTGGGHGALFLYNHGGAPTVKLTADSHANYINNGNSFGIGTTSPSKKLHVYNTAATDAAMIESTQSFSTLAFKSSTNSSTATFGIDGAGNASMENKLSSGSATFVTNGSERMRIDSSGGLLVGKTSGDTSYIQPSGSSSRYSLRLDNNYGSGTATLINNQNNATFNAFIFENGGSSKGKIEVTTSTVKYYGDGSNLTGIGGGGIGVSQSWSAITRNPDTSYQNTSGGPIMVVVGAEGGINHGYMQLSTNNSTWVNVGKVDNHSFASISVIVPAGHYYKGVVMSYSGDTWAELS